LAERNGESEDREGGMPSYPDNKGYKVTESNMRGSRKRSHGHPRVLMGYYGIILDMSALPISQFGESGRN
jgi:hypothetical protein